MSVEEVKAKMMDEAPEQS